MLQKHPRLCRENAPAFLRRFCPDYHVKTVSDIDPQDLKDAGVKAVLMDLDNTLLPWKGNELPQETIDWVENCHKAGLKLCLVSNTRNLPRLKVISDTLRVSSVTGKMKPSRHLFQLALKMVDCGASEVVMVGDQMFTDVWGANRMGIPVIWVERLHHREFLFTRFSRWAERVVMWLMRKVKGSPS